MGGGALPFSKKKTMLFIKHS